MTEENQHALTDDDRSDEIHEEPMSNTGDDDYPGTPGASGQQETQEPPPSTTSTTAAGESRLGGTSSIGEVATGDIHGSGNITIGHFEMMFESEHGGLAYGNVSWMSRDHFEDYSREQLEAAATSVFVDGATVFPLIEELEEQRVLILTGKADLGKGKIAEYISTALCRRRSIEEVLMCRNPEKEISVDMPRMLSRKAEWAARRVILIRDAFNRNQDLSRLATTTDRLKLERLRKRLSDHGSYLILTSDEDKTPKIEGAFASCRRRVAAPSRETARSFLERSYSEILPEDLASQGSEFINDYGNQIIETLETIPRLRQFVRIWMVQVISERINLEEALKSVGRLDTWMLKDRAADLDILSSILALVLGQFHALIKNVNWFQYAQLRQEIKSHLLRELRRHREPRDLHAFLQEADILRAIEAELAPLGVEGEVIRFVDPSYAEKLWDCLIGPGRGILIPLIPLLDRLTSSREYFVRDAAAGALGRIGQIDPYGLTYPRLRTWARSRERFMDGVLGSMLAGVLGSGRKDYKKLCLDQYRQMIHSSDYGVARSAIIGLRDGGRFDLDFVTRELKKVAEKRLLPPFQELKEEGRQIRLMESKLQQHLSRSDLRLTVNGEELDRLVYNLLSDLKIFSPQKEREILFALQYCLVGLCFEVGTGPVLRRLTGWVPPGQAELAPLLAFLFLRPWGIADVLERFPIKLAHEDIEGEEEWSPIVYGCFREDDDMRSASEFLFEIFLGTSGLPSPLNRIWRSRFFDLLRSWARQAAKAQEGRTAVKTLFRHLLEMPDRELQDDLFDFLQHDTHMAEEGSKLETFSMEVLTEN